jgi:hypothetical protein
MMTSKKTTLIVAVIFLAVFFIRISAIFVSGEVVISTKFYPGKNRTLLGLIFSTDWIMSFYAKSGIVGSVVQIASFFTITASTGALAISLSGKSKWRDEAVNLNAGKSITKRDRSLIKLVIIMSLILIACYCPGTLAVLVSYAAPEFRTYGKEENLYNVTWTIAIFLEGTHSSISVFVYYRMSSRYRQTFWEMFCLAKKAVAFNITICEV